MNDNQAKPTIQSAVRIVAVALLIPWVVPLAFENFGLHVLDSVALGFLALGPCVSETVQERELVGLCDREGACLRSG